jgi:hypothetical protein
VEVSVILTCNYEELSALRSGAGAFLNSGVQASPVAAPSTTRVAVESLLSRLGGTFSLSTLAEVSELELGVRAIVEHLRAEVDLLVLSTHPAAEQSVAAYFEFAHALSVLGRVENVGQEMKAVIEVVTGEPADEETTRS